MDGKREPQCQKAALLVQTGTYSINCVLTSGKTMTPIIHKIVRETKAVFRGDPVIVELHPNAIFVRTKRSRERFAISYSDLYEIAAMREAKRKTGFAGMPRPKR